ncbi:MAG: family oxidoreductase [Moraxellaceae bacterium]|jgi:NAD(P)-dependent dehydrogenase (short-subunit alcohol dehydrogenase family)|nr:family oxidoreductase [Moraxellaceae bacterium]
MMGNYQDLESKTFLVTGASSGIGRAIAIALSRQKAKVYITGRSSERLDETLRSFEGEGVVIPADLTVAEEREHLVDSLPALDGVCHCAGIINPFPIRYVDQAQLDKIFDINGAAPMLLTSRLLGKKKIRDDGALVFISSVASERGMKGGSLYSASKAALEAFSRSITLEHSAKRIRSNCLKPALVRTPLYEQAKDHATAAGSLENYEAYETRYPLGIGTPEDVASAALFLLSSASRWITGTSLVLDGGLTASI